MSDDKRDDPIVIKTYDPVQILDTVAFWALVLWILFSIYLVATK